MVVPVTPAQGLGSALCPGIAGTSRPSQYLALYATCDFGVLDVMVTCGGRENTQAHFFLVN